MLADGTTTFVSIMYLMNHRCRLNALAATANYVGDMYDFDMVHAGTNTLFLRFEVICTAYESSIAGRPCLYGHLSLLLQ